MIVAHHIAKTGGTSLMHHVRSCLGDQAYFGVGKHSAADRFFAGQPIWEDLDADSRSQVVMTLGHNLGVRAVNPLSVDEPVAFFLCVRDPVAHAVSQFHHRQRQLAPTGRKLDFDAYIDSRRSDPIARDIWAGFQPLSGGADFGEAALIQILSLFAYIAVTEDMAGSTAQLCADLGISPLVRRDRVSDNHTPVSDDQRARILAKAPLDQALYSLATAGARADTPLAYNPTLKAERLAAYRSSLDGTDVVAGGYARLAGFLAREARLEAAKLYLTLGGRDSEAKFAAFWAEPVPAEKRGDALYKAKSEYAMAEIHQRYGDFEAAEAALREALSLWPDYPLAKCFLAGVLNHLGQKAEAKSLAAEAITVFPGDENLPKILVG